MTCLSKLIKRCQKWRLYENRQDKIYRNKNFRSVLCTWIIVYSEELNNRNEVVEHVFFPLPPPRTLYFSNSVIFLVIIFFVVLLIYKIIISIVVCKPFSAVYWQILYTSVITVFSLTRALYWTLLSHLVVRSIIVYRICQYNLHAGHICYAWFVSV